MNESTQYVRIAKKPESENSWYRSPDLIGAIFEVRDEGGDFYIVIGGNVVCSKIIRKSDCIPLHASIHPLKTEEADISAVDELS